jgi:hypothetical protein
MRVTVSALVVVWLVAAGVTALPLEHRTDDASPEHSQASWSLPGAAGLPTVGRERVPRPTPELHALPETPQRDLLAPEALGRRQPSDTDLADSAWGLSNSQRGPPISG